MLVHILAVLLLLLSCVCAPCAATTAGFKALKKAAAKKPVVKLSPTMFSNYIDAGPKNYTVVLELTSLGVSFRCPECLCVVKMLLLLCCGGGRCARIFVYCRNALYSLCVLPIFLSCSSRAARCLRSRVLRISLALPRFVASRLSVWLCNCRAPTHLRLASIFCPQTIALVFSGAHEEFELAAESYQWQVGGVDSDEFLNKPIFFATLDYRSVLLRFCSSSFFIFLFDACAGLIEIVVSLKSKSSP